jgi:hypothetical protein
MSATLITLVGLAYFGVAIDSFIKGEIGFGVAFLGYTIGNIGLFLQVK